jgi:hypothetical protein
MASSSPAITRVGAAIWDRRPAVVLQANLYLRLKGLDGLLVREGQRFLDDLLHRAVRVRAACTPR